MARSAGSPEGAPATHASRTVPERRLAPDWFDTSRPRVTGRPAVEPAPPSPPRLAARRGRRRPAAEAAVAPAATPPTPARRRPGDNEANRGAVLGLPSATSAGDAGGPPGLSPCPARLARGRMRPG